MLNIDMDVERLPLKKVSLFDCGAHPCLTAQIADLLDIREGNLEVGSFSDQETRVVVRDSVRGSDVYLVQPTCSPVNQQIMNLLIVLDSVRRASASTITAVIPYFGYSRQEKKLRGREPITAKLIANLLTVAGAQRIITFDLHTNAIQGFFDIPVDHLSAIPLLANYFLEKDLPAEIVVVSPDAGGVARARAFARRLHAPLAIIDKRRPRPNQAEMTHLIGDVRGRVAILVDDLIDTAGTIAGAARLLDGQGALAVYACATHAVFSGPARERLQEAALTEVVVTDTIPTDGKAWDRLKILSVAPLISETIYRINHNISISTLFE